MRYLEKTLILFVLFLSIQIVNAQNAKQQKIVKELDHYFEKALKDWNVPGMSIAIVKDDQVVLAKGFGLKNIEKLEKVDENTLFPIASNTKSFTAAALAILVDEGKINWDDPVRKYLPWFELYDPYVSNAITIRDLLCHRSGLATFSGDLLWFGTIYSKEEIVKRAKFLKPVYGFREQYGYSNINYLAAGLIVEKVTGKSWDDFIREKFLKPLGMARSNTSINSFDEIDNVVTPHTDYKNIVVPIPFLNWDNIAPAGSINSSAAEMTKWLRMQLNKGSFEGKKYFSEKVAEEMWASQIPLKVSSFSQKNWPSTHFKAYGLGWNLLDYHGKKVISHSGGYDGIISYSCIVPEINLGFVILTNKNSSLYYPLSFRILDAFLDKTEKDWSSIFLDRQNTNKKRDAENLIKEEQERVKNTKPSLDLNAYTGVYQCEMYGTVKIELTDQKLQLTMNPAPLFTGFLEHWHYDVFSVNFRNFPSLPQGKVIFTLNAQAKVETMLIDVPNPDFDFTEFKFIKVKE